MEPPAGLRRIFERWLPRHTDPKFRHFLSLAGYPGLKTLAAVEIAAPLLMLLGRWAAEPEWAGALARLWHTAGMAIVGILTLLASRLRWTRDHARFVSALSVGGASVLLIASAMSSASASFSTDQYTLAGLSLVVLTAAATVPFRPLEMFGLGVAIEGAYFFCASLAPPHELSSALAHGAPHEVFLAMLVLLATGICSTTYQHRKAEFAAHQEAIRVAEALTGGQLRAQLAENAISIGKLAAALTHEINSPLGTMRSSIETLLALTDRQVDAPPARREILVRMRQELCRSIAESAARIEEVMSRLRRFISLEEAELKSADLNDLLSDVALLHQEQIEREKVRLEFHLEPALPRLMCRPQLLSAVFSSLLSNAMNAVDGNGRIAIATRLTDSGVEVTVSDNGRGMSPEEADSIFEPSFKVADGRVSSGNWSLFNARQIVYEHGGEIGIDTAPGKGTAVRVTLPLG